MERLHPTVPRRLFHFNFSAVPEKPKIKAIKVTCKDRLEQKRKKKNAFPERIPG